jgi:hypothetical protein
MMPLPTLVKTWAISTNNPLIGTSIEQTKQALFFMKDKMKNMNLSGFGWTVVGSCDSLTYGMDGIDRWNSYNDVKYNTSWPYGYSWIVMASSVLNCQVMLAFHNNSCTVKVWMSTIGFSGGAVNSHPTASDYFPVTGDINWGLDADAIFGIGSNRSFGDNDNGKAATTWLSAWNSSDGASIRFSGFCSSNASGIIFFEKPDLLISPAQWPNASVAISYPSVVWQNSVFDMRFQIKSRINGVNSYHALCTEGTTVAAPPSGGGYHMIDIVSNPDSFCNSNQEWLFAPVGLYCLTTGRKGRHCDLSDLFIVTREGLRSGTTFPNNSTRQFIKVGHFLLPWDGSEVMLKEVFE